MDQGLADRLTEIEQEYGEVEGLLTDPAVLGDPVRYGEVSRRYAEIRPLVLSFRSLKEAVDDSREAIELADVETDPDLAAELRELAVARQQEADRMAAELRAALTPSDPDDVKDAIIEIRAAAGGAEAALWAGEPAPHVPALRRNGGLRLGADRQRGRRGRGTELGHLRSYRPWGVREAQVRGRASTGCSGFRGPSRRGGSIPRRPRWP